WQDAAPASATDFTPPTFTAPSATHCHRLPAMREVPGGGSQGTDWRRRDEPSAKRSAPSGGAAAPMAESRVPSADKAESAFAPPPWPQPAQPSVQRPARETVTAGVVDDNADFGEYLAYRQRSGQLPVRERDISERYLLEVSDAQGRPVHDAEVAVQRPGVAQPVAWARTDTAGRVWLHPRAFLSPELNNERVLGVAVRKGGVQSHALLMRGQAQAVQVKLGANLKSPMRLDLVFLIDATGSMGDEIAKLKHSMRAMAQQISQLPGQPDICYGLVAYRDRGDAFITRTHDFTDDLGAFQQQLAAVQAHGGGDTPEALNEALHEVVHSLSWRQQAARMVVLVADAPPHLDYGGPQYDHDMQAALAKGIKLFAVGASGLDPVGEYIYRQMAQYTAGRFVFLTYREATNPGSGPGTQTVHDVKQYSVQTLDQLVVRLVSEELARLTRG
ncbi:MAG TPA: vWA domain-containing protein, partial [Rhizobacter sp.]|nr:vWA domain-containing protein [Rhizobacter sp.]